MQGEGQGIWVAKQQRCGGDIFNIKLIWEVGFQGGCLKPAIENYLDSQTFLPVRVWLLSEEICVPHGPLSQDDFSESRLVVLSIKILPQRQTHFLNTFYLLGLFIA